jgi:hypothetical protein
MLDHLDANYFILTRPTGGLTDLLSQIGITIDYSKKHNRFLLVDTEIHDFFNEPFSNYFVFDDSSLGTTKTSEETINFLNQIDTRPKEIFGRLDKYTAEQISPKEIACISKKMEHFTNLRDSESKSPLTFNMTKTYKEALLVHHCSGGDTYLALNALRELRPTDNLRKAIHSGLSKLPKDYSAIHIRNTDIKADMSGISEALETLGNSPILICSDDLKMADKLIMEFPSFKFISLSNSVSYRNINFVNMTLHKNNPELPRSEVNTMMFIELIAMATASNFYAVPLIENPIKSISGFSKLVMGLRENDIILKMFLQ